MAVATSLTGVVSRLLTTELKKSVVLASKFGGSASQFSSGGSAITTIIPTTTPPRPLFPDFVANASARNLPTGTINPLVLGLPSIPGFPSGPQIGDLACDFLSGRAKELCLAALVLLPGPTPGGPIDQPGAPGPGGPAIPQRPGAPTSVTQGAFGLPAAVPVGIARTVRSCGKRMVLGIDNLCYPKAVLPPRSKFRKWRRPPRVPVTRRDVVAIRRSAAAKDRVAELAKDVGLKFQTKRKKKS